MTDLDAFLDALDDALARHEALGSQPTSHCLLTSPALRGMLNEARAKLDTEPSEPATPEHWSPWLDWHGGPDAECPLPDAVLVLWEQSRSGLWDQACEWTWRQAGRFSYLADNPAGWLKRPEKWIPPTWLWDEGCPVRCEWTRGMDAAEWPGTYLPPLAVCWNDITHIRLVARGRKPEMPEGWKRSHYGHLVSPEGVIVIHLETAERHGPDAIRQAVEAWLETVR